MVLIGDLERNGSDFSVRFISLESIMDANCTMPVVYDSIYREQNWYIQSCPDWNVTKSFYGVHESLLEFDATVAIFMIGVFILSTLLLLLSASVNRTKNISWKLTRIWLYQDAEDSDIRVGSARAVLNTSKLAFFLFIIYVTSFMNTDLVTYSKPTLIKSRFRRY